LFLAFGTGTTVSVRVYALATATTDNPFGSTRRRTRRARINRDADDNYGRNNVIEVLRDFHNQFPFKRNVVDNIL
jgi:hypothetical protein